MKKNTGLSKFMSDISDYNIFILRLLVGVVFLFHFGWNKVTGGPETWAWLGSNIGVAPVFFGFLATLFEFGGALLIVLGLFTRWGALAISLTLLVAIVTVHTGDIAAILGVASSEGAGWGNFVPVFALFMVNLSLLFSGGGKKLNLERHIFGKEH
ncbi:MAG: DoxX family protein [Candidatus Woesearchaeota archaeon]